MRFCLKQPNDISQLQEKPHISNSPHVTRFQLPNNISLSPVINAHGPSVPSLPVILQL